jgi:N-acetylmuramic acid 6-phosphate etherase
MSDISRPGPGQDAARPQLDVLPAEIIVQLLLNGEARVIPAVRCVGPQIAHAAELVAGRFSGGGRLIFVGAGTSGRIAAAEAAELPGTFGIDRSRVIARIAGGLASTDDDEDDLSGAAGDVDGLKLVPADVLVAVAASGSTPYTVAVAEAARAAGCAIVAVVTSEGTPLHQIASVTLAPLVGAEVLRGSSRLTAGTAQKVVLNCLTTAAMARLGRVHGDLMIDVVPANAKLRQRSAAIVAQIAGVEPSDAARALDDCDGNARAAVLVLTAGLAPEDAIDRAARNRSLREAMDDPGH